MVNEELVELLNSLRIKQTGSWEKSIPKDIWNEHFKDNFETVAEDLKTDKHRWYETSIEVIKINNGYIGIKHVSNVYSESMTKSDVEHILVFYEMKEIKSITYKIK